MPAPNDPTDLPPEIPSFRKEKEEKRGAGVPVLGAGTGGKPVLRLRGLGGATSLVERFKQFKKKDIAFILSGLGVLFLAPVAEHFIMGPREDANVLRPSFDSKNNPFVDVSPNELGAGGLAPGGPLGQSADVITPLNVRDPSALVMGPGATQQPAASVTAPTTPKKDESFNDALNLAASRGARSAVESAGPPAPRGSLAGAIRGLSALSGASYGGGPSYSLAPISASNVPNRPGESSRLSNVSPIAGYKGVAPRGMSQGSSGIEAARAAADRAGNLFNRAGSAANNLDAAAREAIPTGGRGDSAGGPSSGEHGKDPGGSQSKDNKSLGESLAFLKAKMEMEKAMDLKWKKKEWSEYELPKMFQTELLKGVMDGIVKKGFFDPAGALLASFWPQPGGNPGVCTRADGKGQPIKIPGDVWKSCWSAGGKASDKADVCGIVRGDVPGWNCWPPGGEGGKQGAPDKVPPTVGSPAGQDPLAGGKESTGRTGAALEQTQSSYERQLRYVAGRIDAECGGQPQASGRGRRRGQGQGAEIDATALLGITGQQRTDLCGKLRTAQANLPVGGQGIKSALTGRDRLMDAWSAMIAAKRALDESRKLLVDANGTQFPAIMAALGGAQAKLEKIQKPTPDNVKPVIEELTGKNGKGGIVDALRKLGRDWVELPDDQSVTYQPPHAGHDPAAPDPNSGDLPLSAHQLDVAGVNLIKAAENLKAAGTSLKEGDNLVAKAHGIAAPRSGTSPLDSKYNEVMEPIRPVLEEAKAKIGELLTQHQQAGGVKARESAANADSQGALNASLTAYFSHAKKFAKESDTNGLQQAGKAASDYEAASKLPDETARETGKRNAKQAYDAGVGTVKGLVTQTKANVEAAKTAHGTASGSIDQIGAIAQQGAGTTDPGAGTMKSMAGMH